MCSAQEHRACPYFHAADPRCSQRFTLERLSEVFRLCLGEPQRCAIYHELTLEGQRISLTRLAQAG